MKSEGIKNQLWFIFLILWLMTLGIAIVGFFTGQTSKSSDERIAVLLKDNEKSLVLSEMRDFLNAVHEIQSALSDENRTRAAAAAENVGMKSVKQIAEREAGIMLKLPLEMKILGIGTHLEFDRFAELLRNPQADNKEIRKGLSELTKRCVICHNQYKIISQGDCP